MVTSQASSGLVQSPIKLPACARVARYSGKYLPACRIIHSGVLSTGSRSRARKKRSFCSVAISAVSPERRRIVDARSDFYYWLDRKIIEYALRGLSAFPYGGYYEVRPAYHITPGKDFGVCRLKFKRLMLGRDDTVPVIERDIPIS